ncbi:MAG TPA: LamG-like jellyroll fold domain-containing protein, partial [Cyclobacteriaceae bacterium]
MKNKLLVLALLLVTISTQAQVGKWLLNNNANDATSNAINGTLTGSPTFSTTAKEGGYALVTNGTSQYVDLGNPSLFPSGTAARTISAWAMTNSVSGSRSIFAYGTNSTSKAMVIGQNGTSLIGGAFASNLTVTSFWATGVWHHICLTYDGTTAKLYADGSLVASQAMSWSLTLAKAYIGRGVNSSDYWSGSIDDVRIYNTALTATQVQTIATAPPAVPTGLTATSTAPTSVSLNWTDASTDETGFSVERSTTTGTGFSVLTTTAANATSYTDATATEGTNYFYRIQSTNAGGSSVYTSEATVTTLPNAPTGLTATTASATSITLNWTDASSKETGYDIERSLTSGSGFSVVGTAAANAITYTDASLATGTIYYYRIKSKVGTVGSAYTAEANATTAGFDSRAGAELLTNIHNWSSSDAAYTNVGATLDQPVAPCGNNPLRNVWFKFQATTNEIQIKLLFGGTKGTINHPVLTLFDASGNVLKCYNDTWGIYSYIQYTSLTLGAMYYFSVDDDTAPGTFTLEVTDTIGFDLMEKAELLTNIHDWSSADAVYSNVGATLDQPIASCGNNPLRNVWFKFQATTNEIEIKLLFNGIKGTINRPVLTLFDASGHILKCYTDVWSIYSYIQYTALTPGAMYYFSVDDDTAPGTFTLEVTDTIGFDLKEKAELLTNIHNWSSSDAAYTNAGATFDDLRASCGSLANQNVWFKFQATTNEIEIKLLFNGTKGTINRPVLTLFDASGHILKCYTDVWSIYSYIQYTALTPGAMYYFSIDDDTAPGTFTLQVTDTIGFDLKEKAELLTNIHNWSSGDAAYTNVGATFDTPRASCGSLVNQNVWFKFQATTNKIDIHVLRGGVKGTINQPVIALYDASGNVLNCAKDSGDSGTSIQNTSLSPRAWYYFSIDDDTAPGTFTLNIDDGAGYDFRAYAELLTDLNNWSSSDAAYTNVDATGTGFNEEPNIGISNVWFKFQATTNEIDFRIFNGGTKGTINEPQIFMYDVDGNLFSNIAYTDIQRIDLTPGSFYYFMIDVGGSASAGTFTIQINDHVNYNMRAKAELLTDLNNWTSADGAYTNVGATGKGFNEEPGIGISNVWFKFQATTSEVDFRILNGGTKGTINEPQIFMYDENGNRLFDIAYTDIQRIDLTPGSFYYFMINVGGAASAGTFTIQINDHVNYNMRAKAELLT